LSSVPIYSQPDNFTCVPTSLKMVMDYLNATKLASKMQTLSVAEIAKIVNTDILGTEIEDVKNLNSHAAVTQAIPSVEFDASMKPRELEDIEGDIKAGLPPICWITKGKAPYQWKHAVVVTGVDRRTGAVQYIDPAYGALKVESLQEFTQEWYDSDRVMVRVILGRKESRKITEYMPGR